MRVVVERLKGSGGGQGNIHVDLRVAMLKTLKCLLEGNGKGGVRSELVRVCENVRVCICVCARVWVCVCALVIALSPPFLFPSQDPQGDQNSL